MNAHGLQQLLQGIHFTGFQATRKALDIARGRYILFDEVRMGRRADFGRTPGSGRKRNFLSFLSVINIFVPTLRERKEDIPVLIDYFLRIQSEEEKRLVSELNPSALSPLIEYPWHGNVRELKNFIEKIVILYPGEEISSEKAISLLERSSVEEVQKTTSQTLVDARKKAEREAILAKLIANNQNYEQTEKALGISRATLFNRFFRHSFG